MKGIRRCRPVRGPRGVIAAVRTGEPLERLAILFRLGRARLPAVREEKLDRLLQFFVP